MAKLLTHLCYMVILYIDVQKEAVMKGSRAAPPGLKPRPFGVPKWGLGGPLQQGARLVIMTLRTEPTTLLIVTPPQSPINDT